MVAWRTRAPAAQLELTLHPRHVRTVLPIIGPRILPLHPGETLNAGEIFNQAGPFPASTGSRKLCYLVKGLVDKGLGSNMPVGSPNKKNQSLCWELPSLSV